MKEFEHDSATPSEIVKDENLSDWVEAHSIPYPSPSDIEDYIQIMHYRMRRLFILRHENYNVISEKEKDLLDFNIASAMIDALRLTSSAGYNLDTNSRFSKSAKKTIDFYFKNFKNLDNFHKDRFQRVGRAFKMAIKRSDT